MEAHRKASPAGGWYGAMQATVGHGPPFCGIGGQPLEEYSTLHHVLNARSFYQTNVSDSWKDLRAHQLGPDSTPPQVYEAWQSDVTNGSEIPADMLEGMGGSLVAYAFAWWSPDRRMALPSSGSREQANADFFTMCHVVSLAPEWYSAGLVRITISPPDLLPEQKGGDVRPDSYDGMTSPLWVQHPGDEPAATGGDAPETLNASQLTLGDLHGSCQAYVVADALSSALEQSPSVNVYSVDLDKVSSDEVLGAEQTSIVLEVRAARAQANQGFAPPAPLRPEISALIDAIEGGSLGGMTGRDTDWKTAMDGAGRQGRVAHRGQRFPFEQFQQELERSPGSASAIMSAAAELLEESDHPGVLNLVASLGRDAEHHAFYDALLRRLEGGRPFPDAHGTRSAAIESDMLERLRDKYVATHPELAPRAHSVLHARGRHDLRLAMLNHHDPGEEKLELLKRAVTEIGDGIDRSLVALTGAKLLATRPDHLEEAARSIAGLSEGHRTAFHAQVRGSDSGEAITRILGIPDER